MGSGWAFPVSFSDGNYQVNLSSYEENIDDSINAILQTRMGERCMEPQFGSGLQQFVFKKPDASLQAEITEAVRMALLHCEPRITVLSVTTSLTDPVNGLLEVNINYMYNQTNTRHNYVFPFHIKEGTNL